MGIHRACVLIDRVAKVTPQRGITQRTFCPFVYFFSFAHQLASARGILAGMFPHVDLRTASLVPLPGKGRCQREQIGRYAVALQSRFGLPEFDVRGHHDHLQAVVAALPAAAVLGGRGDPIARGESGSLYSAKDCTQSIALRA